LLRRISLLFALGLGCIALAWGLFSLQGIFLDERDDAREAIEARRRALEQYAHKELEQRLRARLAEAKPAMDAAASDPLVPASELWLVDTGRQLLPRMAQPLQGDAQPGAALYRHLRGSDVGIEELVARVLNGEPDSPWAERLLLYQGLRAALIDFDRPAIEQKVREILGHRARFVIASTLDIPFTLAMLAELDERATPQKSLMQALLRDGLQGGSARIEGVQRALLRNRERFTVADTKALAAQIVKLSQSAEILFADFEARANEAPGAQLPLPSTLEEPTLTGGGTWYVEPPRNDRVRGISVKLPALLDEISATMRARSLIGAGDHIRGPAATQSLPVSALSVSVESPRWQPALRDVEDRYQLKAALQVVIAALVFGVMALAVLIYRRRHRFLELKSGFVSAVSHELRTPLASIRLMAETLERRTQGMPKARDYPTRIIRDIDSLSFLVENILSFSRLDRGRWIAKRERIQLADVVAKLEQERDSWARRPATQAAAGLEQMEMMADPDLVHLLLTNLARNATAYCERNPCEIHIEAARGDDGWLLQVRDNGVGIEAPQHERIFDDFYRGGSSKSERGSGLGLAICRKIMEAHGGTISVGQSSPAGTTFELRFPDVAG
jgi:two-component system sensor histidine kinase SenX3